jgi:hypothetical protein
MLQAAFSQRRIRHNRRPKRTTGAGKKASGRRWVGSPPSASGRSVLGLQELVPDGIQSPGRRLLLCFRHSGKPFSGVAEFLQEIPHPTIIMPPVPVLPAGFDKISQLLVGAATQKHAEAGFHKAIVFEGFCFLTNKFRIALTQGISLAEKTTRTALLRWRSLRLRQRKAPELGLCYLRSST